MIGDEQQMVLERVLADSPTVQCAQCALRPEVGPCTFTNEFWNTLWCWDWVDGDFNARGASGAEAQGTSDEQD